MKCRTLVRIAAAAMFAGLGPVGAGAAAVDLADLPLFGGGNEPVAPNIFFILDDSSSMTLDYMPDDVYGNSSNGSRNCFRNSVYNKLYYDNTVTYVPPKKADGSSYANAMYTAAKSDGFSAVSTTVNLAAQAPNFSLPNPPYTATSGSKDVRVAHTGHGYAVGTSVTLSPSVTSRGVTVSGTYIIQSVSTNSYVIQVATNATSSGTFGGSGKIENGPLFYYEYTGASPATPVGTTCYANSSYTRKAPLDADKRTNFANWYSYYRTRINLMKSSVGRAFEKIDDKYRVGLDVISNQSPDSVTLNIAKFDATQKSSWYTTLYATTIPPISPNPNYTPLRGALSKAGRLYAGKVLNAQGDKDPVQFSCQQNFTILTTDGYWNKTDEDPSGKPKYGPYKEDNSTPVGDTDGVTGTLPPYLDAGKYANTLADVAMYYYKTDLRTSGQGGLLDDGVTTLDVFENNVPGNSADLNANHQRMELFGLGLGVAGTLNYSKDYATDGNVDYTAISQGTKNWPDPNVASNSATVTTRIDDLWHAAVNGRGRYLSASNPDEVVDSLGIVLGAVTPEPGSGSAAATSSLEPVSGDEYGYVAQYTTVNWDGELLAKKLDASDGTLATTNTWSANTQLKTRVEADGDGRVIYTFDAGFPNKLKSFESANLGTEIDDGYFRSGPTNPEGALTQYSSWTVPQQTAATDDAMIAFLRGQYGTEDQAGNTNELFRDRLNPLGDIVNSSPVYVNKPPFGYNDAGYAAFVAAKAGRGATVYVGANDGMLHAFDASSGKERWAYIPSVVIPSLYKLADADYENSHRFYVDGPITVGDAKDGSTWKTVLIGGLGRGGRAFYALDVTDPAAPKALWEFGTAQASNLGYSYGNPILTKRASDGKWVVLVTSGYNNVKDVKDPNTNLSDGMGRLYVLDAFSGKIEQEIVTDSAIADANVSGIGKINNWVDNTLLDNTTQYVYGGDLGGTLWRFDLTASSSQKLGKTSATTGDQPITVRPELGRVRDGNGNYHRVVYFGTGRYLGFDDISATAPSQSKVQALYAVKDKGTGTSSDDIGVFTSAGADLVEQTLDKDTTPREIPDPLPVDWAAKNGWYLELPVGERVNVDPRLQLGTFVVVSNEPDKGYCKPGGGESWLYAVSYDSGAAVLSPSDKAVGFPVGKSLATGLTLIKTATNKLIALVTQSNAIVQSMPVPVPPAAGTAVRRVGWREIF